MREKVGQLFLIRPDQLDTRFTLEQVHNDKKDAKGVRSYEDGVEEINRGLKK